MQFAADDVEATTTYVEGGWENVNETVTLRDETVDVRGNVTVGDGGRLVMVIMGVRVLRSKQEKDVT